MNDINKDGAMAQLVAHLHGMEGVGGSNPPSSTIYLGRLHDLPRFFFILYDAFSHFWTIAPITPIATITLFSQRARDIFCTTL